MVVRDDVVELAIAHDRGHIELVDQPLNVWTHAAGAAAGTSRVEGDGAARARSNR